MAFQVSTNQFPAPAVAGDFASSNPRASVLAGAGQIVAATGGVYVGRFAWLDPVTNGVASNVAYAVGGRAPDGFVKRNFNALITAYLGSTSFIIPAGLPVDLFNDGDFWAVNSGTTVAVPGQKAFANYGTGLASFAAAGATPSSGGTSSAATIAASTASVTGSIADTVLTVTAVGSGTLVVGGTLSGTGVQTGTQITGQLSGTTGGIGTYSVSIPHGTATASVTISETYGTMTVGGTITGTFAVGDVVASTNAVAGTVITALGTGTGGAGTYIVSPTQTISSAEAVTAYGNVETKWYAQSFAAPGELVKISTRL